MSATPEGEPTKETPEEMRERQNALGREMIANSVERRRKLTLQLFKIGLQYLSGEVTERRPIGPVPLNPDGTPIIGAKRDVETVTVPATLVRLNNLLDQYTAIASMVGPAPQLPTPEVIITNTQRRHGIAPTEPSESAS